jgi:repressor LexA
MRPPTKRQKQVLDFIIAYSAKEGVSPTLRELAKALGFSSLASCFKHLEALREKGLLTRDHYKWRSLSPVGKETPNFHAPEIPLIGEISRGEKIELSKKSSSVYFPEGPSGETLYAFVVKDSSFLSYHIEKGDRIALAARSWGRDGELLLVTYRDRAFLGNFREKDKAIQIDDRLIPIGDVTIRGAIQALFRSFSSPILQD